VESSCEVGHQYVRYAALLRPFMDQASSLELHAVWRLLLEDPRLVDDETRNSIEDAIVAAEVLPISLEKDGKPTKSRDIYFAFAEGRMFDENAEAKKALGELSLGPGRDLVPFLFHDVCLRYSQLVLAMRDVIRDVEERHSELKVPRAAKPQCIYCLGRDGDFGPEEHIIPEALGSDTLILHDTVCATCNNKLSKLDKYLVEFGPLAVLRVFYVPLTKKGKFPRAVFPDLTFEKIEPRRLRITTRMRDTTFEEKRLPDGSVHLRLRQTSHKPLDVQFLGRSLFKIGLGLVAHDHSVEYACSQRFDKTRAFIWGQQKMPNHLLISKTATPTPTYQTWWKSFDASTTVSLNLFGLVFAFNLEPTPFSLPDDAQQGELLQLWLGGREE